MKDILEIVVLVPDGQQAEDFATLCAASSVRTYHEFSFFECPLDERHIMFFYLVSKLSGGADSVVHQLIPRVPLSIFLLNQTDVEENKYVALYQNFKEEYKTPLFIFLDGSTEEAKTLGQDKNIDGLKTPVLAYSKDDNNFLDILTQALRQLRSKINKEQ